MVGSPAPLRRSMTAATRPSEPGLIPTGLRPNARTTRRPAGGAALQSTATRSTVRTAEAAAVSDSPSRAAAVSRPDAPGASSTTTSTPGTRVRARASERVKAACSGPRRATSTTSRTRYRRNAARACGAMSVRASVSGSAVRMRAMSTATLPLPMSTTRCTPVRSTASAGTLGWPVYQPTRVRELTLPASCSPGTSSVRSPSAPMAHSTASCSLASSAALRSRPTSVPRRTVTRGWVNTWEKCSVMRRVARWSGATP